MKIVNTTLWNTAHLKGILQKAAEIELEPAKRKVLQVTVTYTRGGQSSGCAFIRGRHATVRIRHPHSRKARYHLVPDSDPRHAHGRWSDKEESGKVVRDTTPLALTPEERSELALHFASVASHEFAHIRGMEHAIMPAKYKWSGNWREYVAWAAAMPLEVAVPKGKVKPTVDAKLDHTRKMLKLAETRAKRANTIVKKWKRRESYYLRTMAARAAQS